MFRLKFVASLILAASAIVLFVLVFIVVSSRSWSNFSQHPGFSEYYLQYPRSQQAANAQEQVLLDLHRPRLFIDETSEGPISFYRDYIAQGVLKDSEGEVLADQVDSELLNRYRKKSNVVFVHQPKPAAITPEVLARIDYDEHPQLGKLAFLTYHFVFRQSGIAAGLPRWQEMVLPIVGDANDWHQLDHYTAATVVLNGSNIPIALILQQHNHERSYVFCVDLPYPTNERIRLVSAKRSNELYPWHLGVKEHRVVQFMNSDTLPYLVRGVSKPWLAGNDVTEAAREVDYQLVFFPANDAFYSFSGYLGQRRKMMGRDAPPGADYNALPVFKRPLVRLVAFNWQEGDVGQMNALLDFLEDPHTSQLSFSRLLDRFKNKLNIGLKKSMVGLKKNDSRSETISDPS